MSALDDPVKVYVKEDADTYHEKRTCPRGADPVPTMWRWAVDDGREPCGKCCTSFEEAGA